MSRDGQHAPHRWDSANPDQLVTPPAVAARLGLKVGTLNQWRRRGKGPPWIAVSRKAVRYRACDVEAWIKRAVFVRTAKRIRWRVRTATRTTGTVAS
jgi:predicted DNA-binding transcriptional regulator AlpA